MFSVQIGTDSFEKTHTGRQLFEFSKDPDIPFRFLVFVLPCWLAYKQVLVAAT
jgi:hypothetical protein